MKALFALAFALALVTPAIADGGMCTSYLPMNYTAAQMWQLLSDDHADYWPANRKTHTKALPGFNRAI